MSSLVPCVCWVPKGAAKENPDKVELSQEEIQQLIKEAQDQMRELKVSENEKAKHSAKDRKGEAAEKKEEEEEEEDEEGVMEEGKEEQAVEDVYDLDHYSNSESEGEGEKVSGAGMGNSLAGLAYYASNDSDPYITLKKTAPEDDEEEDVKILPTDNLLTIGRAEEEFSSVEVYVYSESDVHTYSHHEILLTSFPLALEWLNFDPEQPDKKGSYLAVGMISPGIEIWDLDIMDGLEPVSVLGNPNFSLGVKTSKKKKKKKKNKPSKGESEAEEGREEGHRDAVLGLSWNKLVRNILASASADKTVKVWDLSGPKCVATIPHPGKVQCLQWHPYEPHLLATGAFDKRVRLYDGRAPEGAVRVWLVDGEVEKVLWNHLKPEQLLVSTDAHSVFCLDKNSESPLFHIHGHNDAITDLSLSCHIPGLLVTASSDDTIKFWDIQDNKPVFLLSRDMFMGAVLCARFCVDAPYALAVGGSKNGFQMIDVSQLHAVSRKFRDRDMIVPVINDQVNDGNKKKKKKKTAVEESGEEEVNLIKKDKEGIEQQEEEEKEEEEEGEEVEGEEDSERMEVETEVCAPEQLQSHSEPAAVQARPSKGRKKNKGLKGKKQSH